jgi:TatD DNase family protein
LIDFHCHLDLFPNPAEVAETAERAGVYVLSVTTTPKAWRQTAALAKGKKHIRTALGIHPQLAHERSGELALFEHLLDETRYVGEVGLDGSQGFRQHGEIQMRVFERILSVSRERGGKIFTVHSRGAADAVVATLVKHRCASTAVLHWFSGTEKQLEYAISAGCWFSVGPAMLRSEKGKQLVLRMPKDRLLTETDGPFAVDKSKPLQPEDVALALRGLASLWSMDKEEVDQLLRTNLKTLLS